MKHTDFTNINDRSQLIPMRVKEIVPAHFMSNLNGLFFSELQGQALALALLVQKNIQLDGVPGIEEQQKGIRVCAKRFQDNYLKDIFSALYAIKYFYNDFNSFYSDVLDYIKELYRENDFDVRDDLIAVMDELVTMIKKREKQCREVQVKINEGNTDQDKLFQGLEIIKKNVNKLYSSDAPEMNALKNKAQLLAKEIEAINYGIAHESLDSVSNIIQIVIGVVFTKNKSDKLLDEKEDPNVGKVLTVVDAGMKVLNEAISVQTTNQALLIEKRANYRACIEKLEKYSLEVAIFEALSRQWESFSACMLRIVKDLNSLSESWGMLAKNFISLKEQLTRWDQDKIEETELDYVKAQWVSIEQNLFQLREQAILFEEKGVLKFSSDSTLSPEEKALLELPRVNNPRYSQLLIASRN